MFGGFIGNVRRLGKWELREVVVMGFDFDVLYLFICILVFCKTHLKKSRIETTIFFNIGISENDII